MDRGDSVDDVAGRVELVRAERIRRVVVESPFAGDVERNERYARAAMHDCIVRGENPIASHLLLTQPGVLDDGDAFQRQLGIELGLQWAELAEASVVYADLGLSKGMLGGIMRAQLEGRPVEIRLLGGEWSSHA